MMVTAGGQLDAQGIAWSAGARPGRSPAIAPWSVVSGRSPGRSAGLCAVTSRRSMSAPPPKAKTSTQTGRRERHVAWR